MSDTDTLPDFPVEHMLRIDEMINRQRWVVPVLPKISLEVLLDAAINLCQAGEDTQSEHCQEFFKEGLKTSFTKLMTGENIELWKKEIHACIFSNAKRLVELCVAKLSQDCTAHDGCIPLLDSLTLVLSPDCQFHTVNRLQRPNISKSDGAIFAEPIDDNNPKGWLADLVNIFGKLHGFEIILKMCTKQELPPVEVIAALIKPFGRCINVLTNQTIHNYLMPIAEVILNVLDELFHEENNKTW